MIKSCLALIGSTLTLSLLPAGAQADGLLSARDFRNEVISAMQADAETDMCVVRLTDDSFRAGPSRENCEYYAYTDAAYLAYTASPDQLGVLVSESADQYVRLMQAGLDETNFEDRLVVQLRPTSYIDSHNIDGDTDMVTRHFTGDLIAVMMLDSAETLATVTHEQLAEHGVSVDEAFTLAAQNTRSRMGDVSVDEYRSINFLSSSNGLISGQIWLPETCSMASDDAAYFVWDRNGLMSVEMDNVIGISNLLSMANGLVVQGDAMSGTVVSCRSGQWSQLWPAQQQAEVRSLSFYQPG